VVSAPRAAQRRAACALPLGPLARVARWLGGGGEPEQQPSRTRNGSLNVASSVDFRPSENPRGVGHGATMVHAHARRYRASRSTPHSTAAGPRLAVHVRWRGGVRCIPFLFGSLEPWRRFLRASLLIRYILAHPLKPHPHGGSHSQSFRDLTTSSSAGPRAPRQTEPSAGLERRRAGRGRRRPAHVEAEMSALC
jgi:hypothetical protein